MFFLSASANIIIYSLVPALLFVCLQMKGETKIPELQPVAVSMVISRDNVQDGAVNLLQYFAEWQDSPRKEIKSYTESIEKHEPSRQIAKTTEYLLYSALRAPPSEIVYSNGKVSLDYR